MSPRTRLALVTLVVVLGAMRAVPAAAQVCSDNSLALQILGSGGPTPSARASTGYLVWRNGRSVALVDTGGGVFQRFGQAGGRVADLRLVAISHLHPDHVSDLPALLWLTNFRTEPLSIAGPSGAPLFPRFDVFLDRLVDAATGALPVLSTASVPLDTTVVDADGPEAIVVYDTDGLRVAALGVPHGNVPTLAYRIEMDGSTLVFGSDQTGTNPAFAEFALEADMLVMHLSLSPAADPQSNAAALHATPAVVGDVAEAARARGLVLGHVIVPRADDPAANAFSGVDRDTLLASAQAVREVYAGQIVVAEDLQCIVLQE